MVLNSFHFGLAFSKDIAFDKNQADKAREILNKISEDGNSFFFSIYDSCEITRGIRARLGRFAGNRIQNVPFDSIYSEDRHIRALAHHTLLPVIYFSNNLSKEVRGNLFIFNFNEYEKEVKPFIEKREPIQVDQHMLPTAFLKCTCISTAKLKIRDPYCNFRFLTELIKNGFFDRGTLEYHFLRAGVDESKEELMKRHMSIKEYKKKISGNASGWMCKELAKLALKESDKKRIQAELNKLKNNKKLSLCMYLLKDQHNSSPIYFWEDSAAHWHHRYISIETNMNKAVFESSHSFIYRKERTHYFRPLEKLHFRLSEEGVFSRFANAFDGPEVYAFPSTW